MKQYRKKILIILGVLSLLVVVVGSYPLYRYLTHDRYKVRTPEVEPASYEFLADRQGLVISWKYVNPNNKQEANEGPLEYTSAIYGKRYLSTDSKRLIHRYDDNRFDVKNLSWGEYWKIQVYDTSQDDLPRKEYDLLKAVANYDASYFPVSSTYINFVTYNGQEYRKVVLQKTGGHDRKEVLFNMETGNLEDVPKELGVALENRYTYLFNRYTSLKNYYYNDDFIDNTTCLNLSQSVIDQSSDWRLKERYPKAYDLMSKEKGTLYFLTNETDVKLLSDIFSLLIPKDRDLFDNLTVYGEVTKDGKEHVVHSYEEFISVLKPKEELSNVR
ncbi:hypothetical protein KX728_01505 [Streptococcus oralis]|uniref:hypothetical protein n=1 Tax=Streptococcus oralis TaxID=1303 RepID=UPI001C05C4A9|nr:hypothetical protein [Streptococcus oralis]MBU0454898.1 hypothetical protein [Streptococcus oralis]MBZ2095117.1 hypothetical protein [Streptococcus oralis]MBZ2099071.1 hypothetical protein [Streptococcus oralis]QXW61695.1 hypothetical protein KX728_01505 [Streptococcus oralis]